MDKIRTFTAVQLPQEIHRRLAAIEKILIETGADVKWVTEDNFHITMKFLGPVQSDRMDEIQNAVAAAAAASGIAAFDVSVSGLGAFPRISHPSVIWAGISSGANELEMLASRLEDSLEVLGFPRESRKFSAHITLGRARSLKGAEQLREAIEKSRNEEIGSFTVRRIAVMKSDLRQTGPVYTPVADIELGG